MAMAMVVVVAVTAAVTAAKSEERAAAEAATRANVTESGADPPIRGAGAGDGVGVRGGVATTLLLT